MNIIYLGSVIILLLMVSNSCLAALGDTKSYRNVLIFSFFKYSFKPNFDIGNIFWI